MGELITVEFRIKNEFEFTASFSNLINMFALKAADESIALSEALSLQTNVEIEIESRNCKQILTSKHIG